MTLPPSTANWHWKTKHVTPWAKQWFERELTTLKINGDGDEVVLIEHVTDVEGDVEVGQRKSKLITIYDCKVELKWTGTASDGTSVSGTLTIPEVSHEITVDGISEYTYYWTLSTPSSGPVDALYKLARTRLPVALETKLAEFPSALLETHGKDLTVSADPSPSSTKPSTPQPGAVPALPVPAPAAAPSQKPDAPAVNTETVRVEAEFQAAADDLFSILTDETRIPHWSRAPAQSKAEVGTEYSLFGGGVRGSYTALTPGKEIVQTWILNSPTWPSGHTGKLTTTFEQSADSTKVVLKLAGVPKGLEDEMRRNLEGYYIRGLKSIGYVQLVREPRMSASSSSSSRSYSSPAAAASRLPKTPNHAARRTRVVASAVMIALLAMGAAFLLPWSSYSR